MKVSIIIACYNHARFLKQAVDSAINQTYPNIEIIIANDGSTDDSLDVARSITSNKIKILTHENKGVVFTRNDAISKATGDLILPLDADDYLFSNDVIEKMVNKLVRTNASLVYGGYQCFGVENNLVSRPNFGITRLLKECYISATTLFKKSDFEKIGGYSEKMAGGYEDWEFNIRFMGSFPVVKIEEIIFYYRTLDISRNTEAKNVSKKLYSQIISNNKELFSDNLEGIFELYEKDKAELKRKIKRQNKARNRIIGVFVLIIGMLAACCLL